MGYAEAKAKDKNLDSYIKTRNNAKKGSSDYNAAQNKINAAYGKGTTKRKVTVADGATTSTGVMANQANKSKASKIIETGAGPNVTPSETVKATKPKTAMEKAKEAIASGDKKAAKESGLKGGLKRQAKRSAGKKDREMAKDDRKDNKAEGRADKEAEKTVKKESIKAAGSRKAARLMDKSDAAKKAEAKEDDTYFSKPYNRGKKGLKNRKDLAKAEAKTDRIGKRLNNEKTKLTKKADKETLKTAGAPTTFKDFDQMDTKNSKKTAGEGSMSTMYSDGPIKYFKQSIKYDVKEATNPNLTSSARKHYSMNAEADMKSPGKMYNAPAKMYDAPTKMHGKKKGGSIISKHMKS